MINFLATRNVRVKVGATWWKHMPPDLVRWSWGRTIHLRSLPEVTPGNRDTLAKQLAAQYYIIQHFSSSAFVGILFYLQVLWGTVSNIVSIAWLFSVTPWSLVPNIIKECRQWKRVMTNVVQMHSLQLYAVHYARLHFTEWIMALDEISL